MGWRKYFTSVPDSNKIQQWLEKQHTGTNVSRSNYQSFLPEIYAGPPNRLERYNQYDMMDTDAIVSASLDTISEFCTQKEEKSGEFFEFNFKEDASEAEIEILGQKLREWTELNDFDKRIRGIVRQCLKYGDSFYVRDPETYRWIWVDPYKIEKVVVNEAEGKKPEEYWVSDPDLNLMNLTFTNPSGLSMSQAYPTGYVTRQQKHSYSTGGVGNVTSSSMPTSNQSIPVPAKHVVHLSLGEGLDLNWPFGSSILEAIYKTYKQKELLEDAILIYRVHRAPERRVFYIDVGNMPAHRVMQYLEHVKNEINQRRIPTKTGGGANMMDGTFNPMCIDLNTEIPLLDGRELTLTEIIQEYNNGKENWIYSCHPKNGQIIPGKIKWAGVTRKNADVLKITLDNGKELICTPDHKIPVLNKGFIEAKDLSEEDSLISFEKDQHLVKIEQLEEKIDTGCLNVDNDYHTFAINSGIFIKNSLTEDFWFPQTSDGRGSRVDTLPGGESLGQIDDLNYFENKMKQGLQIPKSYITGASSEDTAVYNDGRATTALIAEYRFQKYCERIQSLVNDNFDREFKLYLKAEGVQIDASLFQLMLNSPQNFAKYRQIELDNSRIGTWSQIADTPYISKRFAMKRWLGLTEDEIVENERMWKQENPDKDESSAESDNIEGLGAMGIRPEPGLGDVGGFEDDVDMGEFGMEGESPIPGGEPGTGDVDGVTPPPPPPAGTE